MNEYIPFIAGVGLTAVLCALVILTLDRPLRAILVELCGSPQRAQFWAALSRVVLVAFPLIFALHIQPEPNSGIPGILALATQLEWALVGVVTAAVVIGLLLAAFIPRNASPASQGSADRIGR